MPVNLRRFLRFLFRRRNDGRLPADLQAANAPKTLDLATTVFIEPWRRVRFDPT